MHRTSLKTRSLSVQRETLRVLAASELRSVDGGTRFVHVNSFALDNDCYLNPDIIRNVGTQAGACTPDLTRDIRVLPPIDIIIGQP